MSAPHLPSAAFFAMACFLACAAAAYQRPPPRETLSVPLADDADGLTPQQVHISLVGSDGMRITWITDDDSPSTVEYSTSSTFQQRGSKVATGSSSSYSYILYRSGQIHDVVIGPLSPSTVYYYRCGSNPTRKFSFKTPPSSLPFRFAVAGDLGQTGWTNSTLQHVAAQDYDVLLLPGDLSYADCRQSLWDSFGRLVEPLASSRPWMVTQGNHEIEKIPVIHPQPFVAYNSRWRMPYDADPAAPSASNLYYSFEVAGGAVHVIMLGSYADFGPSSSQHTWLAFDLARLDRNRTPWVVALIHAPWYNSNAAHQGEGEEMRQAMEAQLYGARVDVVFAGHVHAYERFTRVYDNRSDPCGPVHIIIGDGGNREGLASEYLDKPKISVFREASFGHGRLEVANATHALWTWNRNDDDEAVVADQIWLTSLASNSACHQPKST
ncbi:probable purple acid phosphatase 20 [Musa acuminata AAA Group]|uniref:probable purple acid phosphatase 20 n=1 Tax=Musa acuminata AAA Group TaxID=214697 RepID=UPI0031E09E54